MKKIFAIAIALVFVMALLPTAVFADEEHAAPIAWYNFEDENDLGKDVSGNGNDLQAMGEPVQDETGASGKSLYLDGVSSLFAKVEAQEADFVDLIAQNGSNKLTIAFWIQHEASDYDNFDPATWRRVISNGHDGGALQDSTGKAFGGFTMLDLADNYIVPTVVNPAIMLDRTEGHDGTDGSGCSGNAACYAYEEGKWFFVVWTVDAAAGHVSYSVNGTKINDADIGVEKSYGTIKFDNVCRPFSIGGNTNYNTEAEEWQPNHMYTGSVDEVMVFDCVLSDADAAYYMELTGKDVPEETTAETTTAAETTKKATETTSASTTKTTETTAAETTNAADDTGDNGGLSTGLLIGIIAAVVAVVAVVIIIVAKKKK